MSFSGYFGVGCILIRDDNGSDMGWIYYIPDSYP